MARWQLYVGDLVAGARRHRRGLLLISIALAVGLALRSNWGHLPDAYAFVSDEIGVRNVEALAGEIESAAAEMGVDPHLVASLIFVESRGRLGAVSSANALGLMQLSSAAAGDAAKKLGEPTPSREQLLSDSRLNLRLGCRHLRWLFNFRGEWDLEQVLVSYNAGRRRLFGWIDDSGSYSDWRDRELRLIDAGEEHTGALIYALRVIEMRRVFQERGAIVNRTGIVAG